jgi:diphthamide biosynthesis protein 2
LFSSCCVDIVASEHYNADSLIHYGHSCLSLIEKLPVLYVFEKYDLDFDLLKNEINEIARKIDNKELDEKKVLIIYDVSYHHLFGKFFCLNWPKTSDRIKRR